MKSKPSEQWSVFGSIIATVVLTLLSYSLWKDPFLTCIFVGALGGIVHEVAQSNGKLMYPRSDGDGVYLGGAFGLVLGAIAGLLLAQGLGATVVSNQTSILSQSFLAGLGLKGVSEAVAGTNKPKTEPGSRK